MELGQFCSMNIAIGRVTGDLNLRQTPNKQTVQLDTRQKWRGAINFFGAIQPET